MEWKEFNQKILHSWDYMKTIRWKIKSVYVHWEESNFFEANCSMVRLRFHDEEKIDIAGRLHHNISASRVIYFGDVRCAPWHISKEMYIFESFSVEIKINEPEKPQDYHL